MITVRFPSGYFVTYKDVTFVVWSPQRAKLLTEKDGHHIASVLLASGAILEWAKPCKTGDASKGFGVDDAAEMLMDQAERLSQSRLRDLKKLLARYNPHTGIWKGKTP